MNWKSFLKNTIEKYFHLILYRKSNIPVGTDLFRDIHRIIKAPMHTIFDAGANDGKTVLQFRKAFSKAKIYAFEPVKTIYQKCVQNTRHLENIQLEQIALSNESGHATLLLFPEKLSDLNSLNPLAMNTAKDAVSEEVVTTTLDVYMTREGVERINFLKIDVEGWEIKVLKGAKIALQNQSIDLIYCEIGFNDIDPRFTSFCELQKFLESYSYAFYGLYHTMIYKGKAHCSNALFVRI